MKKLVLRKGATIEVIARRWFDSHNGNTYHSVQVSVNGEVIAVENFQYGYDSHYLQTAWDLIWAKFRPCEGIDNDSQKFFPWKAKGFYNVSETVSDVARRKDLAFS